MYWNSDDRLVPITTSSDHLFNTNLLNHIGLKAILSLCSTLDQEGLFGGVIKHWTQPEAFWTTYSIFILT